MENKTTSTYKVVATIFKETEKAIQVTFDYSTNWFEKEFEKVWLPKSQVTILEQQNEQHPAYISIPVWLINKTAPTNTRHFGNDNSTWVSYFIQKDRQSINHALSNGNSTFYYND
jgi:hypothetical protein